MRAPKLLFFSFFPPALSISVQGHAGQNAQRTDGCFSVAIIVTRIHSTIMLNVCKFPILLKLTVNME